MKRKIFLFNYFLKKAVEEEQKLLEINGFQVGMLALALSRASIFHRFASGCSMETVYFCSPKYLEEMFLCLCLHIEEQGNNILKSFNFKKTYSPMRSPYDSEDIEDKDLTEYLEEIYPPKLSLSDKEKRMYILIIGNPWEVIASKFSGSIRTVAIEKLELFERNEKTELIDHAWEQLKASGRLDKMLALNLKHNMQGQSILREYYSKKKDFLLERI